MLASPRSTDEPARAKSGMVSPEFSKCPSHSGDRFLMSVEAYHSPLCWQSSNRQIAQLLATCLLAVVARINLAVTHGPNRAYWQLPESGWQCVGFVSAAIVLSVLAAIIGSRWTNRSTAVLFAIAAGAIATTGHNGVWGAFIGLLTGLLIVTRFARSAALLSIAVGLTVIGGLLGGALALCLDPDLSDGPNVASCALFVGWVALAAGGWRRFRSRRAAGRLWLRSIGHVVLLLFFLAGAWLSLAVDTCRRVYVLSRPALSERPLQLASPWYDIVIRPVSMQWLWPGPLTVRSITVNAAAEDEDLRALRGWDDLECAYVRSDRISDIGLSHLADRPSLAVVELQSPRITDAGLRNLRQLKALKWLRLDRAHVSGQSLDGLGRFISLEGLSLADAPVTDDDVAMLRHLPTVYRLDLSGTQITDRALEKVARYFPKLGELNLARTAITGKGLRSLVGLKLSRLNVSETGLRNRDVEDVASLYVYWLDIRGTSIDVAGRQRLMELLPNCRFEGD